MDEERKSNFPLNLRSMTCPMCNNPFDDRVKYHIFKDKEKVASQRVCGRCYLLVSILDQLKAIKEGVEQWLTLKTSE